MVDTKTLQPENAVLFHHPDAVDINRDGIMKLNTAILCLANKQRAMPSSVLLKT
jgi:hypothetical protein